jgi:hypothetical protein
MGGKTMNRFKKITAFLLCLIICTLMVFSYVFTIRNADHDCTGDDCSICLEIAACENFIRNVSAGIAIVSISIIIYNFVCYLFKAVYSFLRSITLITLKVKLTN